MRGPMRSFPVLLLGALLACLTASPPASTPPLLPPSPPNPWAEVDAYAVAAPPEAASSPESLARYLGGAGEPLAVGRAIYRWIAANVSYDLEGMHSGAYGDLSAQAVLTRRSAVCGGFGNLFEALASAAGLEAVTIHGSAKGTGYRVGGAKELVPVHAWNAFRAGGRWHLVDCTWGAGALGESGRYEPRFEPFYFDTRPEDFVYTHLPDDARWQLLDAPWSSVRFLAEPWLKPAFFHAGFEPKAVRVNRGPLLVSLFLRPRPAGQFRIYLLEGGEKGFEDPLVIATTADGVRAEAMPVGSGPFAFRLFVQHAGSGENLEWAGDVPVP